MVSIRTILVALPTMYLLVALFFMGGSKQKNVAFNGAQAPTVISMLNKRMLGPKNMAISVAKPEEAEEEAAPEEPQVAEPSSEDGGAPPKPTTPKKQVKYYDGNIVNVYEHPDNGADWWGSVEHGWEKDSLQTIRTLLSKTPGATYIDFGSWIGPTVLFAAPYATKIFALEPDPQAYSEVYWNVKLNAGFADKVVVKQQCISNTIGPVTMHGKQGNSMSTIMNETDKQKTVKGRSEWTVECTTLDQFVIDNNLDPTKLVLKMDTEGAERDILRQLKPWIEKYKPSMLLSMHVFIYPEEEKTHAELQEIILSYKTVLFPSGKPVDRKAFTVGGWCRLCALLITDLDIAEGEVK